MTQQRLSLYSIDMKYVRNLSKADDNVTSISPQIQKQNRPFIGIIVICANKQYCVPFSSPKEKHKTMKNDVDFTRMYDDDKLIGVLNFNEMIPVDETCIQKIVLKHSLNDTPETKRYKSLMSKQLGWCQQNQDAIIKKANKLYTLITSNKANHQLKKRCCDFLKLEHVLEKYQHRGNTNEPTL